MGKELVIAEKPSVANDIAKVLGCKAKKNGYIEGKDYVITWAVGHLINLCDPEDYSEQLKKWRFETLPILPEKIKLKPYDKTYSQLEIIKKLINREDVDSLICATDSGREGELIFRYIYNYLDSRKSFKRLWISSMTDEAIKKGFDELKEGTYYDNLYYSAKCRSEADWLVGINGTRAYTTQNNVLLSIGRVQTPTLALIVHRYNDIQNFKPQKYHELEVDYGTFRGKWFKDKISNTRISTTDEAKALSELVLNEEGVVTSVKKKNKKEQPPLLYDLTELQRDGNKLFGYSAKKVLELAQELYEKHKLLTYPRTDSRYLSDDMKQTVIDTMKKINVRPYNKVIEPLLNKGPLKFTKRIIDNKKITDHHAIIPTNAVPNTSRISEDCKNIYNLVVKRFVAVFMDPFLFQTTEVIMTMKDETFISKGKIITDKGWKALYIADKDDKESILPPISKGDKYTVIETFVLDKETTPPKPYTEATLLSAMENAGRFIEEEELKEQLKESGFGTPATRAGIIERLITVKYIVRKGKSLHPTPKGENLIKIVPAELKSPITTGKWEKALTKISKGEMEEDRFMNSIKRFVAYIVKGARDSKGRVAFEVSEDRKKVQYKVKGNVFGSCPICESGQITENSKAYYCSNWQNNCKLTIWKNTLDTYNHSLDDSIIEQLLKDKEIKDFKVIMPDTREDKKARLVINEKGQLKLLDMH